MSGAAEAIFQVKQSLTAPISGAVLFLLMVEATQHGNALYEAVRNKLNATLKNIVSHF